MSNFSKSIGYTAPITKTSVGISQSSGSPVNGNYYINTQQPTGAGVPPPQDGPGGTPVASAPKAAAKSGGKNTTHARADGKPALKPSKTRS